MQPISPVPTINAMASRNRYRSQAFTLIEVILVITILTLMVALVVPNLIAIQRSRQLLSLEASIVRLPAEARVAAVKSGQPVTIQVTGEALVMQQTQTDGSSSEMKQVPLGTQITVENTQQDGRPVDPTAWQWTAYPDGTADSGGLEFSLGTTTKSLVIPRDRNARWIDGTLPDTSQDEWPAGELLQRT